MKVENDMKAMILAAGRGERLRPLTDHTPKPLIEVGGRPLIVHHLLALARAGITEVVINAAWRAGQIQAALGDGRDYGVRIRYSVEVPGALDTGGGVRAALPLLGQAPFMLVSADVWSDFDYARLYRREVAAQGAHLVMVDNPEHNPAGDFGLMDGRLTNTDPRYTYAGIGLYSPGLFKGDETRFSLSSVIRRALTSGGARGEHHAGSWLDVGRHETLAKARELADK